MPTRMVSFAALKVGDKGEVNKKITAKDIERFAALSLDNNPIHLDEEFASQTMFKGRIAHGMLTASLISAAVGTKMPGPGSVWMEQSLCFVKPVRIGDTITAVAELIEKKEEKRHVIVKTTCYNQNGEVVLEGIGKHKILQP